MPRYHFHVSDGSNFPDKEGTALPDLEAARTEAVRFAGELLQSGSDRFWSGEEWQMTVADELGLPLFVLTFIATDAAASRRGNHS